MNSILNSAITYSDINSLFTEVKHRENLGLKNPNALRLFHLSTQNNVFEYSSLEDFLTGIISEYVFSRAQIERLSTKGNPHSIGIQALRIMKKHGHPDQKGTGNELGEILLFAFMEQVLGAPKLFSKAELYDSSATFGKESDSVHLLELQGAPYQCYQTVFGTSDIDGDIQDAVDKAFQSIDKMNRSGSTNSIMLAESHIFEESFPADTANKIASLMIPNGKNSIFNDVAYGIFLGYSLGLNPTNWSNDQFRIVMDSKMQRDIKNHASYIASKIMNLGLSTHSFYVYLLPFNDAEEDKKRIMEELMR